MIPFFSNSESIWESSKEHRSNAVYAVIGESPRNSSFNARTFKRNDEGELCSMFPCYIFHGTNFSLLSMKLFYDLDFKAAMHHW